MTRYSIAFLLARVVAGVLLTSTRRWLTGRWLLIRVQGRSWYLGPAYPVVLSAAAVVVER